MRIISKFHDYYDCIMRQGMDRETIYFRKEEIEPKPPLVVPTLMSNGETYVEFFIVGFCGKVYTGLRVSSYYNADSRPTYLYGKEEILAWLKEHKISFGHYWSSRMDSLFDYKIEEWKHPIFVVARRPYESEFIWNTQLDGYDFQKVMDPYTAFQELQMWVASQARPERPMIATSDVTRLEAHGFDKVFSFRKGKKRKKGKS